MMDTITMLIKLFKMHMLLILFTMAFPKNERKHSLRNRRLGMEGLRSCLRVLRLI